jgi:ankyrin repeat protein
MKPYLRIAVVICLAVLLTGCGKGCGKNKRSASEDDSSSSETESGTKKQPATIAVEPTPEEKALQDAKAFLDKGGKADAKGEMGCTRLQDAVIAGYESVAKLLADKGADVNAKDDQLGRTALHWAAAYDNAKVAGFLISKKADVKIADKKGKTALHVAAESGAVEAARLLVEKGADVNAKDSLGMTPLHYAARGGNAEMVELLLSKDADTKVKTSRGKTALDLAKISGMPKVIELLGKPADAPGK